MPDFEVVGPDDHRHAPRPQDSIVVNRNQGAGTCSICGVALTLRDGKWESGRDHEEVYEIDTYGI